MAWDNTNPVAVGDPTKKDHYDTLWNNATHHRNSSGNFEITKGDADEAVHIADSNSGSENSVEISRSAGSGKPLAVVNAGTGTCLDVDNNSTGKSLNVDGPNSGSNHSVNVSKSGGSGNCLTIANGGTGNAISIDQTGDKITHGTTTKYLMINPISLIGNSDQVDYIFTNGKLTNRTTLTEQTFYAPLVLPDGVTITEVVLYGCTNHASATLRITSLNRILMSTGAYTSLNVSLSISGTGGYQNATDNTLANNVIENTQYSYYFIIGIDPGAAVGDCELDGIRVAYATTNLKQTI